MSVSDTTDSLAPSASREPARAAAGWAWAAFVVALVGLAGSLALTWGMGLKACPLCFYQRTFMMSLVAVLGMGLIARAVRADRLGLLALPLTTAGLGVALFHVSLEVRGRLECPQGLLGLGTAPQQSLVMFVVLFALLVIDLLRGLPRGATTWGALAGAVVLGGLLAAASSTSNPPMQRPAPETYAKPPDVCRPPQAP